MDMIRDKHQTIICPNCMGPMPANNKFCCVKCWKSAQKNNEEVIE